jgi:hypothetical protein
MEVLQEKIENMSKHLSGNVFQEDDSMEQVNKK